MSAIILLMARTAPGALTHIKLSSRQSRRGWAIGCPTAWRAEMGAIGRCGGPLLTGHMSGGEQTPTRDSVICLPMTRQPVQQPQRALNSDCEFPCPSCPRAMRLVGREQEPGSKIDLLTFQCACGQILTHPRRTRQAS